MLKTRQTTVAERLRLEIKKHAERQRLANVEAGEIHKALKEIDLNKRLALEQYKRDELGRLAKEREGAELERLEKEREERKEERTHHAEPADGMMAMHKAQVQVQAANDPRSPALIEQQTSPPLIG